MLYEMSERFLCVRWLTWKVYKQSAKSTLRREQISLATGINSRLGGCQVRMFNIQKNGEALPDCVLTDKDGVNYATLSTSAKIESILMFQELFRSHYGVQLMTWVDECSIFDSQHLPKPDGQCCYLFAGDSPTLVVDNLPP